ncbi:MAG: YifB family Mg chelatase-like AAA ATPase [Candidatus Omnitrophica bacterium]|nr:YifB family Mg chelatase-like AAA ATPase [Candidatus Omnitrophota bacterium]
MLAKVMTATVVGLSAVPVTVEVDVADGLPGVTIVGLPDPTVRESKERIKSALKNTQFAWPQSRITVNLAPADVRKEGSAFDLPIALGLLAASRQLEPETFADTIALGELALDGSLWPIPGALPVALSLKGQGRRLLLPAANALEAALVNTVPVYPIQHLHQAIAFLKGTEPLAPIQVNPRDWLKPQLLAGLDFSEVKGQRLAKRAIEVAVAGAHNLIFLGPPGSGKSMLAQRIPTIMPEISLEESLETTQIYSIMGLLSPEQPLVRSRPFRSPHSTISDVGLVGGGAVPRPGEVSLAHHGVLFLDELPEFSRASLESLRQPLEDGVVTVSRAVGTVAFPARFMLVASMNPCPCGFSGDPTKSCLCTPSQIHRYRTRISGPLLDRIDLHLEVPAVSVPELTGDGQGESSAAIRARIAQGRDRQRQRFQGESGIFCNAQMRYRQIKRWCRLTPEGKELLKKAIPALGLSARAYDKILKVSRTIADLAGSEEIHPEHLAEAIQYRALDRSTWV